MLMMKDFFMMRDLHHQGETPQAMRVQYSLCIWIRNGSAVVSVDPSASLFICGADVLPVFSFFDSKIVK